MQVWPVQATFARHYFLLADSTSVPLASYLVLLELHLFIVAY